VDTTRCLPEDLQHIQNWRVTPTFILIVNQQEIGRFRGYGGELWFWQQAEMLIARLPPVAVCAYYAKPAFALYTPRKAMSLRGVTLSGPLAKWRNTKSQIGGPSTASLMLAQPATT